MIKFGPRFAIPSFMAKVRGEHGCSCMSTMTSALAQANCYLSSRPQGVVDIEYSEQCGHCRGSGRVPGKRRLSWHPCKVCKGQPELTPDMRVATVSGKEWSPFAA